jgi:hypothetical protein
MGQPQGAENAQPDAKAEPYGKHAPRALAGHGLGLQVTLVVPDVAHAPAHVASRGTSSGHRRHDHRLPILLLSPRLTRLLGAMDQHNHGRLPMIASAASAGHPRNSGIPAKTSIEVPKANAKR